MANERIEWNEGRIELVDSYGAVWTCDEAIIGVILTPDGKVERAWFGDKEIGGEIQLRAGGRIVNAIQSGGVTTLASGPRSIGPELVDYQLFWMEAVRTAGIEANSRLN